MATSSTAASVKVIEPRSRLSVSVVGLIEYRELLTNLVRKELRVKYKSSTLGFLWSLLNPALYVVVFWIVFTKFLGSTIPSFPIFLLSGLLAWNLFSGSLGGAVGSLIGNANLVTKVYFPREILPFSAIGASLMHFFFQLVVLIATLVIFRYPVSILALVLVPAALVVELLFVCGASLIVAVLNVYFRDVQHLLELVLLAWFWMTPIVYPIGGVQQHLGGWWRVYMLNPMTSILLAFQRGVYAQIDTKAADGSVQHLLVAAPVSWYVWNLVFVAAGSVVVLVAGWAIFRRLESRLAEEL